MKEIQELPYEEIAKILRNVRPTIKSRLHRARNCSAQAGITCSVVMNYRMFHRNLEDYLEGGSIFPAASA